jgi:hypothetical protein
MAERRMFAKTIIDSDEFLDMPLSTQSLYFHLSMRADDDGFINNPKKIMRMIGAANNEIDILLAKRFLLEFESGVVVIKHWKLHNYIQKDRYKETVYIEEKGLIQVKDNNVYTMDTKCVQLGDTGKVSIELDKESIDKKEVKNKSRFTPDFSFIENGEMSACFEMWCKGKSKKYSNQIQLESGYKKLSKLSNNDARIATEIVENSLANNWSGLFELKSNKQSSFKTEKPISNFDRGRLIIEE